LSGKRWSGIATLKITYSIALPTLDMIAELPELENLIIDGGDTYLNISDVGAQFCTKAPRLTTVYINMCKLKKIPTFLTRAKNLKHVAIKDTFIGTIPHNFLFASSNVIETLNLSSNKISIISPNDVFVSSSSLTKIDMSHNDISLVSSNFMTGKFPLLEECNLSHNKFVSLPETFCQNAPRLAHLSLKWNTLSPAQVSKLKSKFKNRVDISHNVDDENSMMLASAYLLEHTKHENADVLEHIQDITGGELERFYDYFVKEYIKNPSVITRHLTTSNVNSDLAEIERNLKKRLDATCTNVAAATDELVIYIDTKQRRWCFTKNQLEDICRYGYHPYLATKISDEWRRENCNDNNTCPHVKSACYTNQVGAGADHIELSERSEQLLDFWTKEIYTFGQVFFHVPCEVQADFARTRPCMPVTLFRGISFQTIDVFKNFMFSSQSSETELMIENIAFTSWTTVEDVANWFANRYTCGIIFSREFTKEEILVDTNVITYKTRDEEYEVIVNPGVYTCKFQWFARDHIHVSGGSNFTSFETYVRRYEQIEDNDDARSDISMTSTEMNEMKDSVY
jgi:hypothetical protein